MDDALEIRHGDARLQLQDVLHSPTRVDLSVTLDGFGGRRLVELDARDVRDMAGWLLRWLAETGNPLPALPAALETDT
jgi:hypothetical protein